MVDANDDQNNNGPSSDDRQPVRRRVSSASAPNPNENNEENQIRSRNQQPDAQRASLESSGGFQIEPDESAGVDNELTENEENIHQRRYERRHISPRRLHYHHPRHEHPHPPHQHKHKCHHHHHHGPHKHVVRTSPSGHVKELIKPDPTVKAKRASSRAHSHENGAIVRQCDHSPGRSQQVSQPPQSSTSQRVATVVDEEQLHKRLMESISSKKKQQETTAVAASAPETNINLQTPKTMMTTASSHSSSTSSSSSSGAGNHPRTHSSSSHEKSSKSPPAAAIIIPPNVAKSLSAKTRPNSTAPSSMTTSNSSPSVSQTAGSNRLNSSITREQLQYGPLLKSGEVQVLYRSPEAHSTPMDRHLKDEQAKQVAPNMRQSPISIMSVNPTYELQNKPLELEYPATVENLRLNNTGFSWEVKIPYQISMTTALYGAHLSTTSRFRLDQFHCHWGSNLNEGSEHTVDNRSYSAEMHFVHYNMEKYHTLSKAARHADGLVVVAVFIDAQEDHHNHAELEKIVSQLKSVPLKGEHAIIKQAVRIDNLLPGNRSYWSYQGSLTTPPYFESVTWFVFKQPIKCSPAQIEKFRNLKSSLHHDMDKCIRSNYRKSQPLNGRTIVNYDESSQTQGNKFHSMVH